MQSPRNVPTSPHGVCLVHDGVLLVVILLLVCLRGLEDLSNDVLVACILFIYLFFDFYYLSNFYLVIHYSLFILAIIDCIFFFKSRLNGHLSSQGK